MSNTIRVRFAPSPTGHLHVGGARTALFNYLYAKSLNGTFILRVEDTDQERSNEDFLKSQLFDLKSLGINPDEGVFLKEVNSVGDGSNNAPEQDLSEKGDHGPYKQSKRKKLYKEQIQVLLDKGLAYYCFLTDKEIDQQKEEAKKNKTTQQIISPYRPKNLKEANAKYQEALSKIESGLEPSIRFNTSNVKKDYSFKDLVRGNVKLPSDMVGDFVIQRSNGMPVYNFCCVVDDALMKISHVLRAEEHLSNTLRQLMIYEALGFTAPQFAHMSLILGEDKKKLSKRHGAASVEDYLKEGYLPTALVNFLCLLGWSHPESQEIFNLDEVIKAFKLDRLNSAPAVFDTKKLLWMNGEYIKGLGADTLEKKLLEYEKNFLPPSLWGSHVDRFFTPTSTTTGSEALSERLSKQQIQEMPAFNAKIKLLTSSIKTLKQGLDYLKMIYEFNFSEDSQEVLTWPETKLVLEAWKKILKEHNLIPSKIQNSSAKNLTEENFISIQNDIKTSCNVKGKNLFMPIRVAVIGKPHGAELKDLVPLIQIPNLIDRVDEVIKKIN